MFMTAFITLVAAYLIGSINFAIIFTKAFTKKDIRSSGSGNAGATNVLRVGGIVPALLTFLCDALKGFAASGIGYLIFSYISRNTVSESAFYTPVIGAFLCGLFCMLGHIFPLFFGFKGGKGVAVSVGIMAVCSPVSILVGLGAFAIVLIVSKYVSLSSLIATAVTVAVCSVLAITGNSAAVLPQIFIVCIMGAIIFIKHISNIKRLVAGDENKIGRR